MPFTGRNLLSLQAGLTLTGLCLLTWLAILPLQPPLPTPETAPASTFSATRAFLLLRQFALLPHPQGTPEHDRVRDVLTARLRQMGLSPQIQTVPTVSARWNRPYRAGTVSNIWARVPGRNPTGTILLAAHYDSVSTGPGASDDGASVAAALETLRALQADKSVNPGLDNDLIVLFTDAEETGLMGARAFCDRISDRIQDSGFRIQGNAAEERGEDKETRRQGDKETGEAQENAIHNRQSTIVTPIIACNFEARGTEGPALMFETSPQNGWLVRQYARAVRQPLASSLFYAVYKRLPNDTDFTEFRAGGMIGLNFAFIDRACHYHTSLDNVSRLDLRSLQHHGDTMLGLARQLGSASLTNARQPDAIYFNLTRFHLCIYPESWAVPLALFATLLTVALLAFAYRLDKGTLRVVAWGMLRILLVGVVSVLAVGLLTWGLAKMAVTPHSLLYLDGRLLAGVLLLTVVGAVVLFSGEERRATEAGSRGRPPCLPQSPCLPLEKTGNVFSPDGIVLGALLWWLLLTWLTTLLLPGGSYLFAWPLLGVLGAQLVQRGKAQAGEALPRRQSLHLISQMIGVVPAILLVAPVPCLLYMTLSVGALPLIAVLIVLTVALLRPQFALAARLFPARTDGLLLPVGILSVACVLIGATAMQPTVAHPQSDSIFYALNADAGRACWISNDGRLDTWTRQFLGDTPVRSALPEFLPVSRETFLHAPAPRASLAPPVVTLQGAVPDSSKGSRVLRLHVLSSRQAPLIEIAVASDVEVLDAIVEGQAVGGNSGLSHAWSLLYFNAPRTGLALTLRVKTDGPITLQVIDRTYGLPPIPGKTYAPRPSTLIATPASGWYQETTLVAAAFRF